MKSKADYKEPQFFKLQFDCLLDSDPPNYIRE